MSALPTDAKRLGGLAEDWGAPPFSVLNTRAGYWQEARRRWHFAEEELQPGQVLSLGLEAPSEWVHVQSQQGRGETLLMGGGTQARLNNIMGKAVDAIHGTSVFDPFLAELVYRWWCPPGGSVLDPFAGGSVRGVVAALTSHPYTGIDLNADQVAANRVRGHDVVGAEYPMPEWLHGDSRNLDALLPDTRLYDMVFSCPPYYDLEVYTDDPLDLSNAGTYLAFTEAYQDIIALAARRLRPNRYAVFVVGEVRDKVSGALLGLVPDTIAAFERAGMSYYNDAILVNSAGTLPVRAGRAFAAGRKLGRMHQYVLVFVKGEALGKGWDSNGADLPSPQVPLWQDEPQQPQVASRAPLASPPPAALPEPDADEATALPSGWEEVVRPELERELDAALAQLAKAVGPCPDCGAPTEGGGYGHVCARAPQAAAAPPALPPPAPATDATIAAAVAEHEAPFLPEVQRVLEGHFGRPVQVAKADAEEDRNIGIDYHTSEGPLALRVLRNVAEPGKPRMLTIRRNRPNGSRTEWHKLEDGTFAAVWWLAAWALPGSSVFDQWLLLDVVAMRRWQVWRHYMHLGTNKDGTVFACLDLGMVEDRKGVVVAASRSARAIAVGL